MGRDDAENERVNGCGGFIGAGQSKWVAERLLLAARARGIPVNIVRPGYVVGSSVTGGEARGLHSKHPWPLSDNLPCRSTRQ